MVSLLTKIKRIQRLSGTAVWQVWGPSADSSRLKVQMHWRLCRRSWWASDWREAYECQPSAVFLGERRWRGSSHQPGSWERVLTTLGEPEWWPWTRRAAALEASAAGGEVIRRGHNAER